MSDQRRNVAGRVGVVRGIALGLVAGILSGLFGIGGGAVLVPLLVLTAAFPQHMAHATSLAAIILTALSGMVAFALQDAVAFGPGLFVAAGAVAGAYLGAGGMHRLSARSLRVAFAILMILTALQLLLGIGAAEGAAVPPSGVVAVVSYLLLGIASGALSALMGVGGGVIMVPALVLIGGLTQHVAEGTSLFVIIPTSIMGAVKHARHGYTDWRLGLILGVGGIVGAQGGSAIALQMDAELLQRLFGAFLVITSLQLLWTSRRKDAPTSAADSAEVPDPAPRIPRLPPPP